VIFPVSGCELPLWLPPLVTFVIGAVCASAGVSGAFLLLPFQMSVLGFTAPAVTPTNLLYNVFGIPGGVARYLREGRLDRTLAGLLALGLVPGAFFGMLLRVRLLSDPGRFKLFVAAVLLLLVARLAATLRGGAAGADGADRMPEGARVAGVSRSWRRVTARLGPIEYAYPPVAVVALALVIGTIGGAYGIGGGALMAPVMISVFRLPVHATAGANLAGTFLASLAGALFYAWCGPRLAGPGVAVTPDWLLGSLFGLGGLFGMYLGASWQRFLPARFIKLVLTALLLFLAAKYLSEVLV
jgi:hypothetical protein